MMNRWTDYLIVPYFELNWNAVYFIIAMFSFCFFLPRNKALCTFILKCSSKRRKISRLQCHRGKGIRRILNSYWLKNAPLAGLTIGAQRKCCLQYLHRFTSYFCAVWSVCWNYPYFVVEREKASRSFSRGKTKPTGDICKYRCSGQTVFRNKIEFQCSFSVLLFYVTIFKWVYIARNALEGWVKLCSLYIIMNHRGSEAVI